MFVIQSVVNARRISGCTTTYVVYVCSEDLDPLLHVSSSQSLEVPGTASPYMIFA